MSIDIEEDVVYTGRCKYCDFSTTAPSLYLQGLQTSPNKSRYNTMVTGDCCLICNEEIQEQKGEHECHT